MPNFSKNEQELVTRLDKWLFFIKNLVDLQHIPAIFKDEIVFQEAFEKAALAKLSDAEWSFYEGSLKEYRDMKGFLDTAFDEGKLEGKLEMARVLKKSGVPFDIIMISKGLSKKMK